MVTSFIYQYVLVSRSSDFNTNNHWVCTAKLFKTFADKTATALPIVSVVAISLILASVVGSSKAQILATGLLIFAVVILHNLIGYILGYTFAKILKLDRPDKRQYR